MLTPDAEKREKQRTSAEADPRRGNAGTRKPSPRGKAGETARPTRRQTGGTRTLPPGAAERSRRRGEAGEDVRQHTEHRDTASETKADGTACPTRQTNKVARPVSETEEM